MQLSTICSMIIFLVYLAAMWKAFGIPYSISETFYLLERKKPYLGVLFTLFCFITAILVMIPMFETSDGEWYQFLALFAGGGLAFVGAAPLFITHEKIIHYVSAAVCFLAALLWIVLSGYWYIPVIAFGCVVPICVRFGKWMFWLEVAAFSSIYLTLLIA